MSIPLSTELARWACALRYEDIPHDVIESTKLRVLDVMGLCLAGAETPFGKATRAAAVEMSPAGPATILGFGDRVATTSAAFVNGALSQALEYDDTHNESIVHMSSPAVAAALAVGEVRGLPGRDLITAIALGNEVSCRVGCVSSGELHKRGFHPTGLFATFGAAYLAGKLLGLDTDALARAAGIAGSFASGLLECWVDGTQTKFLHPGWSAQSGIQAAYLARHGVTGPAQVFEGRWGLFASHVQDAAAHRDFSRIDAGLGTHWESRNASFKPYPAAHVIHPYITAALRIRERHGVRPGEVARVDCPVTEFIVGIVCEPTAEKFSPATDSHGRVSLQYSIAETLVRGSLGKSAYSAQNRSNGEILALARNIHFHIDPAYPGPGRFKGAVRVTLMDGRTLEEVEEYNLGSAENPMSQGELRAKFEENASGFLGAAQRTDLIDTVMRLETLGDVGSLPALTAKAP